MAKKNSTRSNTTRKTPSTRRNTGRKRRARSSNAAVKETLHDTAADIDAAKRDVRHGATKAGDKV